VEQFSWWGVLAAPLGLTILSGVALYVLHDRSSITRLQRMRSFEATFEDCSSRYPLLPRSPLPDRRQAASRAS
jgi:hypothetical protein